MLPDRLLPDRQLADNRATQIVGETLALGGKMLLTSNMRTIDHIRLNEWAVDNGSRFGFKPEPVVFQADDQTGGDGRARPPRWSGGFRRG